MVNPAPRKADRKRWQRSIISHLEDFPRQYAALETAMAAFGDDFDLQRFKEAFDTADDMEAYNRVQAVERALGRVQNFVAELAEAAVKLAQLRRRAIKDNGSLTQQAFEALRDAKVIDASLCRRLIQTHKARTRIEHGYVQANAGDVHRAAELVREVARDFIGPYRSWIERYLEDVGAE
jgi:uncharacterized protein YutE (UPF0331/DUF86 family)